VVGSRRAASCTRAMDVTRIGGREPRCGAWVYTAYTFSSRHRASPRSVEALGASLGVFIIFGSGLEYTTSCREIFEKPASAARSSRVAIYAEATSEPAVSKKADWLIWWATIALSGWRRTVGSNELGSSDVFCKALKFITVLFSDNVCVQEQNKQVRAHETSV